MKELWQHQVDAIRFSTTVNDMGLLFEQGTGKTRTLIEIIRRRFAVKGRVMRTLILAPPIVLYNWREEFKMFSKIPQNDIIILTKSAVRRRKDFLEAVGEALQYNKIIITNYEAMEMDELYELIRMWRPEILVCDESQRVKNPSSIRAKKVSFLADETEHNYILTGTPILNNPMDIFMQYRILDRGHLFGKNFFSFRANYFEDANSDRKNKQGYYPKWVCIPEKYEELTHKIYTKAKRVLKADCLDLPPVVRQVVMCDLSPEQAKMYKEMYNDYITFIDTKSGEPQAVVAQQAVVKLMRLQQIVSGFAKDENDTIHRIAANPRLTVLKQLLEDITPQHKVIVWAVFKENYRMIADLCTSLGIGYAELHGGLSTLDKKNEVDRFKSDASVRVMIANQGAGGVGINLVEASYSIYYSKGFKLEDDLQSEARNHRGGSEIHEKITRIDIVAKGTCDELITMALKDKQTIADQILNWKGDICNLK